MVKYAVFQVRKWIALNIVQHRVFSMQVSLQVSLHVSLHEFIIITVAIITTAIIVTGQESLTRWASWAHVVSKTLCAIVIRLRSHKYWHTPSNYTHMCLPAALMAASMASCMGLVPSLPLSLATLTPS
jgi:hypothetical protein